jgi:hypothetical protein
MAALVNTSKPPYYEATLFQTQEICFVFGRISIIAEFCGNLETYWDNSLNLYNSLFQNNYWLPGNYPLQSFLFPLWKKIQHNSFIMIPKTAQSKGQRWIRVSWARPHADDFKAKRTALLLQSILHTGFNASRKKGICEGLTQMRKAFRKLNSWSEIPTGSLGKISFLGTLLNH